MAYGFGTTVNPQLGAVDYSNYLRGALTGAQMEAQGGAAIGQGIASGLSAIGSEIGSGMKQYAENKKKLKAQDASIKSTVNLLQSALDVENKRGRPQAQVVSFISEALGKLNDSSISSDERAAYASNTISGLSNIIQLGTKAAEEQKKGNIAAFANLVRQYGTNIPSIYDQSRYTPEERAQGTSLGLEQRDVMAQTTARLMTPPTKQSDKDVLYFDLINKWRADNPGKEITPAARAEISRQAYGSQPPPRYTLTPDEQLDLKEKSIRLENAAAFNKSITDAGSAADINERKVDKVIDILEKSSGITGFGAAAILPLKQALAAAGVQGIENVSEQEELQTLFGDFVMGRIASTKGAVSDREMSLYEEYSPSLSKTPEGNLAILKFNKAVIARAKELAKMVRKMRREGKREVDIEYEISEYRDNNPLPFDILKNELDGKNKPGSTNKTTGEGSANQTPTVGKGTPLGGGFTWVNDK
jgi:hypothetical protein